MSAGRPFNRSVFFNLIRAKPFPGSLTQLQVIGMTRILNEWSARGLTDLRWLAYMLATVLHETGQTMQPIREGGSQDYLRSKPYYPWIGMGLVQVTWETNARKFGATRPEDLLSWPVALHALFDGMIDGMFTSKRLDQYFNDKVDDSFGARHIVNGTDKAGLIAGYHESFLRALSVASASPVLTAERLPPFQEPVAAGPHRLPSAPTAPPSLWARLTSMFRKAA